MKLGVFSDMHGNALALRACLDQAISRGVTHFTIFVARENTDFSR